jgi:hypothetical protein
VRAPHPNGFPQGSGILFFGEDRIFNDPFPSLYYAGFYSALLKMDMGRSYWAFTENEKDRYENYFRNKRPPFLNNDIIAYYGKPDVPTMGILGCYPMETLSDMLDELAASYDEANGERGVRKAFYLIYGTVLPGGTIAYTPEETINEYINFTLEHGILLFLDHQIGKYDPVDSLREMFPYLHYSNVHLALDPEWRTDEPMLIQGSIEALELNRLQAEMSAYLKDNNIPDDRMLVIHQFSVEMIHDREMVQTGFRRVNFIHSADGFGIPAIKRGTYAYNALASNMPLKAFKLFYNPDIPGVNYDEPLMSPEEVFALEPRPAIIMYQ